MFKIMFNILSKCVPSGSVSCQRIFFKSITNWQTNLTCYLQFIYTLILDCISKAVGVDYNLKTIPDAQLSSHYASGDHPASDGRLNSPQGWIGTNTNSWLQVRDFNLFYFAEKKLNGEVERSIFRLFHSPIICTSGYHLKFLTSTGDREMLKCLKCCFSSCAFTYMLTFYT